MRYGYGLALLRRKYRDELSWTARDRLRAYRDLGSAAVSLGAAVLPHGPGTDRAARVETAYFGFLRQLGQRIGYLRAAVL
jgi:hypothetical protein